MYKVNNLFIFFCYKKKEYKINKKNNNYVANDMAMSWYNRSLVIINTTFQLLNIYRFRLLVILPPHDM